MYWLVWVTKQELVLERSGEVKVLKKRCLVLVLLAFMSATPALAQSDSIAIKDMRGKTVQVPKKLDRIATISDGFVEAVMTHLGVQRKIVAIGSWSMKRDYKYHFETAKGEKYDYNRLFILIL